MSSSPDPLASADPAAADQELQRRLVNARIASQDADTAFKLAKLARLDRESVAEQERLNRESDAKIKLELKLKQAEQEQAHLDRQAAQEQARLDRQAAQEQAHLDRQAEQIRLDRESVARIDMQRAEQAFKQRLALENNELNRIEQANRLTGASVATLTHNQAVVPDPIKNVGTPHPLRCSLWCLQRQGSTCSLTEAHSFGFCHRFV